MLRRLLEKGARIANSFYFIIPFAIFSFILYLLINQDRRYANDGSKVMGTVTAVVYEEREQRPLIQYTADDGNTYTHDPGAIMFQAFDKGQEVEMYYMQDNPNDAHLTKNNEGKLIKILLGWLALLCLSYSMSHFFALNPKKSRGILAGGLALVLSYVALFIYEEHHHFAKDAVKATGVIVDKQYQKCNTESTDEQGTILLNDCYSYTVEYVAHNNEKLTWQSDREWKERAIGDEMKICYRKVDPTNVRFDVFWDGYGSALIFGILGLVCWFWFLRILLRR